MVWKDDIWSYDIFNLRHVTKVAAHFQRQKKYPYAHLSIQAKRRLHMAKQQKYGKAGYT